MSSPNINRTKKIGKYEILDILGRGGMGVVYKAVDPSIGRLVAIKRITGNFADDPKFLKRFYREAKSTGSLQHQNIVIVHDLGDCDGTPFLVMEFLEGESLDVIIRQERPLSMMEKLNYIIQVCNGLQYAHERNIVHRDIKPANLMVLNNGNVKIVDFGIARIEDDMHMTMPSQVLGTFHYMSKEQINNEPLDGRTDIYSTAVVLYQLLTFHLPFNGKDTGSTLLKIINDPPPPLSEYLKSYPPELDAIMQRALAKSRDERYQTAEEFALDLMQVQEQFRVEIAAEYLKGAEDALQRGELTKAQEQCREILRFERQGTRTGIPLHEAKQLLQQVQQLIQKQQRSDQAQQLRVQAQEALAAEEFDRALTYVTQAVQLDPDNKDLQTYRDSIAESKNRADHHREAFKKAQSAHYAGDLTEALQEIDQALKFDSSNTDAQALRAEITHEIEQRRRQSAVQGLVQEAQKQISSRQFTSAIEALQKAEALDPSAPGIVELMTLASNGRKQEIRRKELERFSSAITDALNQDDYAGACKRADEALAEFPDDRGLVKLKAMAERRREAAEKRQFVEEQVASARKLLDSKQAETALHNLEAACAKYPNEPALMSVLTIVQQTIRQEQEEARKNDILRRAKEALRAKQFDEAVQVLQSSAEFKSAPEIEDLLQFAKEEAAAFQHQQRVEAVANEAHRLMSAEEYEQAIVYLRGALLDLPDEELNILLADAERHVEDFNRRVSECVETAERLLRVDRVTEAVRFLDSQAEMFSTSPRFQEISARARDCDERLQQINAAVQTATTALAAHDWDTGLKAIEDCRQTYGEHSDLARLATQLVADRSEGATAAVTKATKDCRTLFLARSYEDAMQLLDGVMDKLDYVPEALRLRYTALHEEAERGLIWKQQEAELARSKPESTGSETAERTSWALEASTRHTTDAGALRERDLEELQQLAEESATTVLAEQLPAISARARVLADRHAADEQVQSTANQVFSATSTRAISLTSISKPGREFPRPQTPPPPPTPSVITPPAVVAPEPPKVENNAALQEPSVALPIEEVSPSSVVEPAVQASSPVAPPVSESVATPPVVEPEAPPPETKVEPPSAPKEQAPTPPVVVQSPPPPEPAKIESPPPMRAEDLPLELQSWGENLAANAAPPPPPVQREVIPEKVAVPPVAEVKVETPPAKPPQRKAAPVQAPVQRPPEVKVQKAPPARVKSSGIPWPLVAGTAGTVLLIALVVWKMWPTGAKNGIPATVVSTTPAGVTVQVQNESCVTPNCTLQLSPGDYQLRASLAGYKPETRTIHVAPGAPPPADIAMQPLPTTVRVNTNFSNGDVSLDGKAVGSLHGGQLEIASVDAGQHTLRVSSGGARTEVSFEAGIANPPEVRNKSVAQDVAAFAVSTILGRARLDCNCGDGTKLIMDGHDLGQVTAGRQDLGTLSEGSHRLQIGEGDNATTHTVQVSSAPVLDLFLDAERNVGILVVQSKISGASVYIDGRQAGVTDSLGVFRAALPAKDVNVRVSKSGFKPVAQQTATLKNKQETALNFDLQPVVQTSKLVIDGKLSGVSISIDGREVGVTGSKGQFSLEVQPGNHTVELSKNGFQTQRVNTLFAAGDTNTLPADLVAKQQPRKETPVQVATNSTPPPPAVQPAKEKPAAPTPSPDQAEWLRVRDSNDPAALEAFANHYPASPFADVARDRLRQLQTASDRSGILAALQRYADAYQHKNAEELAAIWPSLDKDSKKKLSESFKSAQSIQPNVRPDADPSISGDSATVTCARNIAFTFAGGESRNVNDRVLISLRKKSGAWFIDSVRVAN